MQHYFFDIKNGHRLVDPAGLDCSDDTDAVAKARMIAAQVAQDAPSGERKIAVLNSDRHEVASVPVVIDNERAAE